MEEATSILRHAVVWVQFAPHPKAHVVEAGHSSVDMAELPRGAARGGDQDHGGLALRKDQMSFTWEWAAF